MAHWNRGYGVVTRLALGATVLMIGVGGSRAVRAEQAPPADGGPMALGISLELMPAGKLTEHATGAGMTLDNSADTDTATAVAPFFDYAVTPNLALGFSPQVIFNVKGSNGSQSATEYDLRARLTLMAPVAPRILVFGRVSPAFSFIDLPSAATTGSHTAKGFLFDLAAGVDGQIAPNAFIVFDVGYQFGFQSLTETVLGQSFDVDLRTRYLHFGLGFAVTFGS